MKYLPFQRQCSSTSETHPKKIGNYTGKLFLMGIRTCLVIYSLFLISNVLCLQKPFTPRYSRLRRYNIDPSSVTISGLSNGAAFSVQMGFIYSSLFRGIGCFAGGPYPFMQMVYLHEGLNLAKIGTYYRHIERFAAEGAIDRVENLKEKRVYVFQGIKDLVVPKYANYLVVKQFKHYGAVVKADLGNPNAGHCMPTDNFGDYLPQFGTVQGVCNAGFQGINHMFHHFYGQEFIWPLRNNATPTGQLFKYDQNEFTLDDFAEGKGLHGNGYIYVPILCYRMARCGLHLAFHGIVQTILARIFADGYDEFVQNTGYMQVADANNIIVVFPEMKTINTQAGFDIVGYTGRDYAFKNGTHPLFTAKIIRRLVYGT